MDLEELTKQCTKCEETLTIDAFGKRQNRPCGYASWCKPCVQTDAKRHYRRRHLKKAYGITPDDFDRMMAEQDGKCGICGIHQDDNRRTFSVDHCHKTGRVRGLLCNNCNAAVGLLQENAAAAIAASEWILR